LITRIIFSEEYTSLSSSFCSFLHFPIASSRDLITMRKKMNAKKIVYQVKWCARFRRRYQVRVSSRT
jgi:hypothetical protein